MIAFAEQSKPTKAEIELAKKRLTDKSYRGEKAEDGTIAITLLMSSDLEKLGPDSRFMSAVVFVLDSVGITHGEPIRLDSKTLLLKLGQNEIEMIDKYLTNGGINRAKS